MSERVTASEALYGFAAWLTSRARPVTFSANHDAAPAADLVAEYVKANTLPDPREYIYPHNLTMPKRS
ncbi:MAG: hypothetical protein K0Q50_203 [Vampirovibrio sp.]|jgi:hypothetical protein|nr:hypothetical protein [Vampirovibrio sp.]